MNISIFASGAGTNAENIIRFFEKHKQIKVVLVLSNRADAQVIIRAKKYGIESHILSRTDLYEKDNVLRLLKRKKIDFIVLAGFLWIIPPNIIKQFPQKIVNIHPALLPKYGGKGMYGMRIHQLVIKNKEKESGITIHYVNEKYDEGKIIFQKKCPVYQDDTSILLADRIHRLEYKYYPTVIEDLILSL